jgi:HSP20 family protein
MRNEAAPLGRALLRIGGRTMTPSFSDPFAAMLALQRALDSRLESDWMEGGTAGVGGSPPINIFQQGDDFVAIIELPGIDKNDLQIEAKETAIRISGKKTANYDKNASMHRRERLFGAFDRTISLPLQIDADAIRAEYREGVLVLFIPRAASEKPRTIRIN